MQVRGRRYDSGAPVILSAEEGVIAQIGAARQGTDLAILAPGLVDLQVNGFGGREFNDPRLSPADVRRISRALDSHGVTRYCPTATTDSYEVLHHVMVTISTACEEMPDVAARVIGIHLEGPYLSAEDGPRGAHPKQHCRPPDWDEFRRLQDAARGQIRILTMSPEYDRSADFIRRVVEMGTVVAIGHTAANSEQIRAAVDAGASLSTHLGNGAHGRIPRHPNYIWDQLAEDRLTASLIVDGHHLPAEVVKSFVRAKTVDRCLLVSDITGMAGMPPGRYESPSLASVEVLEDGRLVVAGQRQYLAGAALPITAGIANIMNFAGLDLETAIDLACAKPLSLLGLEPPRIEEGCVADLILLRLEEAAGRSHLRVEATVKSGEVVFGAVAE